MLAIGASAPDFAIGESSLHAMLGERFVVLFFFPKAFGLG